MNKPQTHIYEFGDFRVDALKRLLIKGADEQIPLTPKVFETLLYFVENSGKVIEKNELMAAIWTDTIVEENNLSQNISILRRVLGEKRGEHRFIATIPGHGFKFVADVRVSGSGFQVPNSDNSEIEPLKSQNEPETQNPVDKTGQIRNPQSKIRNRTIYAVSAVILLIAAVSAGFYFWRENAKPVKAPIKSVAVLPFKPLVADNRDEVLEIGMTDTLIARLSSNREFVVRPLSSVRKFGDLEQDAQSAGRELGVESVLDGNIQRVQDKIRVNVRLIGTLDGATLWSGTFDEKFSDIFVVQDAISNKVVAALTPRLSNDEKKRSTENVEAYRFYLQGRYHALKSTPPEIRQGIEFYKKAIDADPAYALAFAGMAQAFAALPITSDVPPNEAFPQAKAAAEKALEIDANLAEARIVLGAVEFWFDWDWTNAEAELKKAIAISPNNPDAHRFYAVLLTVLGRSDEALAEMETARQLDPLSLIVNALKGQSFFYAGRDAEAIDQLQKTFEIDSNFWIAHIILARVYIRQNRFAEAVAETKKAGEFSGGNSEATSLSGYASAKAERRDDALAMLKELQSNQRYIPSYNIALINNGLGNREEALNQLEKAFKERDARMMLIKIEPKWDNLRNDPRFIDLLRKMNFE
jgi:DNA-binding winged helix-turn-helix (wHTH) protein/TolB-like protein/tetratricopeptide (TPR) repeat protein